MILGYLHRHVRGDWGIATTADVGELSEDQTWAPPVWGQAVANQAAVLANRGLVQSTYVEKLVQTRGPEETEGLHLDWPHDHHLRSVSRLLLKGPTMPDDEPPVPAPGSLEAIAAAYKARITPGMGLHGPTGGVTPPRSWTPPPPPPPPSTLAEIGAVFAEWRQQNSGVGLTPTDGFAYQQPKPKAKR